MILSFIMKFFQIILEVEEISVKVYDYKSNRIYIKIHKDDIMFPNGNKH